MRGSILERGESARGLRVVPRAVPFVVALAGLAGVGAMFVRDRTALTTDQPVAAGSSHDPTRAEAVPKLGSPVLVAERQDSIAVQRTEVESPKPLFRYAAQAESRITLDLVAQEETTIELHDLRSLSTPGGAPVTIEMGPLIASLRSDGASTIAGLPRGRYGVLAYRTDWMMPLEFVLELGREPRVALNFVPDAVISVGGNLVAPRPARRPWHGQQYVRILRRFAGDSLGGVNLVSVGCTRMTTRDRYRFRAIPVRFGEVLRIESLSGVFPNPFVEVVVPNPVSTGRIEAAALDPWRGADDSRAVVRTTEESGADLFASGVAMVTSPVAEAKDLARSVVGWDCITRSSEDASRADCEADLRSPGRADDAVAAVSSDLVLDLMDGATGLPAPAGATHVVATHEDGTRLQFTTDPSVVRIHAGRAFSSPGRWTLDFSREGTTRKTFEIVVHSMSPESTTTHAFALDVLQVEP